MSLAELSAGDDPSPRCAIHDASLPHCFGNGADGNTWATVLQPVMYPRSCQQRDGALRAFYLPSFKSNCFMRGYPRFCVDLDPA